MCRKGHLAGLNNSVLTGMTLLTRIHIPSHMGCDVLLLLTLFSATNSASSGVLNGQTSQDN